MARRSNSRFPLNGFLNFLRQTGATTTQGATYAVTIRAILVVADEDLPGDDQDVLGHIVSVPVEQLQAYYYSTPPSYARQRALAWDAFVEYLLAPESAGGAGREDMADMASRRSNVLDPATIRMRGTSHLSAFVGLPKALVEFWACVARIRTGADRNAAQGLRWGHITFGRDHVWGTLNIVASTAEILVEGGRRSNANGSDALWLIANGGVIWNLYRYYDNLPDAFKTPDSQVFIKGGLLADMSWDTADFQWAARQSFSLSLPPDAVADKDAWLADASLREAEKVAADAAAEVARLQATAASGIASGVAARVKPERPAPRPSAAVRAAAAARAASPEATAAALNNEAFTLATAPAFTEEDMRRIVLEANKADQEPAAGSGGLMTAEQDAALDGPRRKLEDMSPAHLYLLGGVR